MILEAKTLNILMSQTRGSLLSLAKAVSLMCQDDINIGLVTDYVLYFLAGGPTGDAHKHVSTLPKDPDFPEPSNVSWFVVPYFALLILETRLNIKLVAFMAQTREIN